ncbi:M56 family metallopeptidase [Pedobacter sp. Hv1]|uniref:M56 family metallopeptidase n=1 Tax=Pedobacter sp. Hv1 TaxID=1740090 RepID=UPI00137918CF|nr:M56 family metallopeptidase [Pedobacter sp. Hv1]
MPTLAGEGITTVNLNLVEEPFKFTDYLYPVYLLVALAFAFKLAFSLSKIVKLWLSAKKQRKGLITLVELNDGSAAFSFFNLLFIHPKLAEKQAVLKHEMVHIQQKHSFDILFFELLQIICWFNPILYFIKKDIKLLHEYIADELTTSSDIQKHEYAMFLIENSFGVAPNPLTNQIFNQSILKRRINMLNKKRTARWAKLRLLLVLPLGGAMLCTSTMAFTKDYGFVDLLPEKSESVNLALQDVPPTTLKLSAVKEVPVKQAKMTWANSFIPLLITDSKTRKIRSVEKRYIVINGKRIDNLNTFYGVTNIQSKKELNAGQAIKKYGDEAKFGAVEINGKEIKWIKTPADGPPPPTMDQIKFPPPVVKPDVQTSFQPKHRYNKKLNQMVNTDQRYIIVNGDPITNNSTFHGVTETESVSYLSPVEAIKVYGIERGKNGAVVIKGSKVKYITEVKVPPTVESLAIQEVRISPMPQSKKGSKQKIDTVKLYTQPIKNGVKEVPTKRVNEDMAKLILKLPAVTVAGKEANPEKEQRKKEDVAKLIQKLPAITVGDKPATYKIKADQKLPDEEIFKSIQKLPSITIDDKTIKQEIKADQKKLPSVKIIGSSMTPVGQKNR